MPYITAAQRAQGPFTALRDSPHAGNPCTCDWTTPTSAEHLQHRRLPYPDQSRYGKATTDPRGRYGPGWKQGAAGLPVRVKETKETSK